ncbi:PAS domain S-box protein [Pontibacter sp. SGAir0037]|uniref:PAS domain-containing sensor histidine kinase n=1 Tax=Pontibacter sp. SGAir0037 TaxID=2571030 RepID=UPI0010CD16A6|nr:PAS domain S-box protein [Pontibacter sp. SGAir0037]QCR24661.1 PAS domain-containing sensor histidine kinase [Pontibacter sp. SGAir0037]
MKNSYLSEQMLQHSPDILCVVGKDGYFQKVSGACQHLLGYCGEEMEGRHYQEFLVPLDRDQTARAVERIVSGDARIIVENRYLHRDGRQVPLCWLVAWSEADALFFCTGRDASEPRRGRLELEEGAQKYRSLFEHNPDIVFFESREGKVTEGNKAFRAAFGEGALTAAGQAATSFLPPGMAAVNARSLQEALLGSTMRFDLHLPAVGNRGSVYDAVKFPVMVAGEAIGAHTIAKDITPIVRSFETLANQTKKLHAILESITDAFAAVDRDWKLTYINSEAERLFHLSRGELLGRKVWDVFPEGEDGAFHNGYRQAMASGETVQFESYYGSMGIWLQVKVYPSEEGLGIYFGDITEVKRSRQEVEKLSLVARSTDNGVIITDATGRTEWVNEGFSRITGYRLEEVKGKKPGLLLRGPEIDKDALVRIRKKLRGDVPFNAVLLNYRKSGERCWVSMDITPVHSGTGTGRQFIAILRDITYRKESEENLLSLSRDLYTQNKLLQEFTYIVSHNLRAPVANALGLANLMAKMDQSSPMFVLSLANLKTSVLQMDTVLKDVTAVLTVREKQGVLELERVRAVEVFRQAWALLQEPLHQCGGEITVAVEEGLRLEASKPYLFSIFYNLLSNAIRFRSGERQLRIRLASEAGEDGSLALSLSDNGTGFDAERAGEEVFKLYKRFHRGTKGRGVGLFLVKAHAEAMGWQVSVSSRVGKGTTFQLLIPPATARQQAPKQD